MGTDAHAWRGHGPAVDLARPTGDVLGRLGLGGGRYPNLIMIVVMLALFVLALVLPFPGGEDER